jgi:peptide/nickel transport system ATP-binding protein
VKPAAAPVSEPVLSVRGLTTAFRRDGVEQPAVADLWFDLAPGEILGLVGESGSGKSVTGFSILRLVDAPGRITAGEVWFEGQDLMTLPEARMRRVRGGRIALVMQDPMLTLNPVLRIGTQMTEVLAAHGLAASAEAAREKAAEALAAVGIADAASRLEAYPHQLSGGMRQRVAIASALLPEPAVLIADEPTTALDVTIQGQILSEVQSLVARRGTALVWITHDLSVVAAIADRVAVMYAGRLVEVGPTAALLAAPAHPYTAGLLRSIPSRAARGQPLAPIPGQAPRLGGWPAGCAFAPRCERVREGCTAAVPALMTVPVPMPAQGPRTARCIAPLVAEARAH